MLTGQCLDRRLADQVTLEREVAAWEAARNDGVVVSTGALRPRTLASSSSTSTQQLKADELLGVSDGSCWEPEQEAARTSQLC